MTKAIKPFFQILLGVLLGVSVTHCVSNNTVESKPQLADTNKPTVKAAVTPAPLVSEAYQPPRIVFKKPSNHYFHYLQSIRARRKNDDAQAIKQIKKAIQMDPHSIYLQKELVLLYINQKDEAKALETVEALRRMHPDNVEILILAARVKQIFEHTDGLIQIYEKIITLDPQRSNVYLLLGQEYTEQNDLKNARRVYQNLIKRFPQSYAGYFFLGRILSKQGQPQAAIDAFRQTLKIKPELEEPRWELIELQRSRGNLKEAEKIYREILKFDEDNIEAAMGLGSLYYQSKRITKANRIFKVLGRRSLQEPDVIRNLIQKYIEKKRHAEALIIVKGMLRGAPDDSGLNYIAASVHHLKKNNLKAIRHYDKVKPDSDFYSDAVIQIAFILQNQGKAEEAIRRLEALVQQSSDKPEILLFLGGMYEEKEAYDKAVKALQQGLELAPQNTKLRFRLGVVYDKWGKKEASIETMKALIGIDPEHYNALNYLGYTYVDAGRNLDEAERLITRALELKPNDGYITDSLGWLHFKKGNYDLALEYLKKAAALVPDDPIILEHLGDAYMKMNTPEKALQYYRRSLSKRTSDKADIQKKIEDIIKNR